MNQRYEATWYGPGWWLGRAVANTLTRVHVEGLDHVPETGPFLLFANHQSAVDPLCILCHTHRVIYSMTKSTQFTHPFMRWLLPKLGAFPTRRYKVDPQAVRITLRLLEAGEGVCIYPEGERTWTGKLGPLRAGSVRLALKANVPVVPCGISGSWRARPRWSGQFRRVEVFLRFGTPIHFGPHDSREARERALPGARRRIESALRALSAEPPPGISSEGVDTPAAAVPPDPDPAASG